jgi:hypothetical protein
MCQKSTMMRRIGTDELTLLAVATMLTTRTTIVHSWLVVSSIFVRLSIPSHANWNSSCHSTIDSFGQDRQNISELG